MGDHIHFFGKTSDTGMFYHFEPVKEKSIMIIGSSLENWDEICLVYEVGASDPIEVVSTNLKECRAEFWLELLGQFEDDTHLPLYESILEQARSPKFRNFLEEKLNNAAH